jgi:hypothetical protein
MVWASLGTVCPRNVVDAAALDEVGCHNCEETNEFVPSPRQRAAVVPRL